MGRGPRVGRKERPGSSGLDRRFLSTPRRSVSIGPWGKNAGNRVFRRGSAPDPSSRSFATCKDMKLSNKQIGCLVLLAVVVFGLVPLGLMFGPFCYWEFQAHFAKKELRSWTKEDCAVVWNEAKALAAKYPQGRMIEGNEIPEPMRRAGFRSAWVSSSKFRAEHGGSCFGSSGAIVICWFEGSDKSAPYLAYSGGFYFPDGRWEPGQ